MYAVIITGGKQYRVKEGDTLKIESLPLEVGSEFKFEKILMVGEAAGVKVGRPYLESSVVAGTVLSQGRRKKITIVKFRRRKHHMKSMGHRQNFTEVKITQIKA